MPKAAVLTYAQVKVGDHYSFEALLDEAQVRQFADLTGDQNPLHVNADYAKKTSFQKNIVHGMLAGSLFSRLIGMYCPGENSLYLSQSLEFRKPVFAGDKVTVKGTVIQKIDSMEMVVLHTEIVARGEVVIKGEAKAKFLTGEKHG